MKEKSILSKVSDYYEINPSKFEELGILDSFMNFDVPLFLNPKLLSKCKIPEFKNADKKIILHYETTINLLRKTNGNDIFWKGAKKHFNFPEPSGVGLGTSMDSVNGKGLTGTIAENCLKTLKEIVDLEIYDPTMYRVLFLIQENVGVDRISDMICRIIYENISLYTNNMIEKLGITDYSTDKTTGLKYLKRPNGKRMLLLPTDLLSDIPDTLDGYDVCNICEYNQEIKSFMCEFFEKAYINISTLKNQKKGKIKECIVGNKNIIQELLKLGLEKPAEVYDYTHDPRGIICDYEVIREKIEEHTEMFEDLPRKTNSLTEVIENLLIVYKRCIESLGLNDELFYVDPKTNRIKAKREDTSHNLFILVLETAKKFVPFEYFFESKVGNGKIEFIVTNLKEKIAIEFKLNSNNLVHGYDVQLPEYIKRYQATASFYVIIKIEDNTKIEEFYKKRKSMISNCNIIEIDGLPKSSPSKM